MYLKSIEVHGFKSFANKIVFDFHNGITGIVGPNGSGKSNVADAVRWVLGEQSAKQLRGASMQDVIFAGTQNRRPVSYAFVSITLDNSDHVLPVSYEEVTVARRVYRSGESEYLINGSACRLKDVSELFYDTGIGKEGYSIIGQGQIERILSGRPEERRELFDEAAGIVKYKRRKAETEKKLEHERENLVRINDILSELERQVVPLEAQAEKARAYIKKKEELKVFEVNLFLMDMEQNQIQLTEISEKYETADKQLQEANQKLEQIRQEYDRLERSTQQMEEDLTKTRELISAATVEKGRLEGKINVINEQIHTAQMSQEHYQNRTNAIIGDIAEHEANMQKYDEQKTGLQSKIAASVEKRETVQGELADIRQSIAKNSSRLEQGQTALGKLTNEKTAAKGDKQRFDMMMEQVNIRFAQLSQRELQRKSEEANLDEAIAGHEAALQEAKERIARSNAAQQEYARRQKESKYQMEQMRSKLESATSSYHKAQSRYESMRNIAERYDGYGGSIRRVMEKKNEEPGIHGVVADLMKVDKKYETAIETALGGSIQNIVTEDEETAKRMVEYLKKNKYGRATFLPLTSVTGRNQNRNERVLDCEGVIGMANTLVQTQPVYKEVMSYLLGRFVVVDHIDHAVVLAREFHYSLSIVTLDGERLNPGGSIAGGAFRNSSSLLGRRRELEELSVQAKEYEEQCTKLRSNLQELSSAQEILQKEMRENETTYQEASLEQNTAKMNLEHALEEKYESEKAAASLQAETEELRQKKKQVSASKAESESKLEELDKEERKLQQEIADLQASLEQQKKKEQELSKQLSDIQFEEANLDQQAGFVKENQKRMQDELAKLEHELQQLMDGAKQADTDAANKENEIVQIRQKIVEAEESIHNLESELQQMLEQKETLSVRQKGFFKQREDLSGQQTLLDKEIFRLSNQKEKLEEVKESQTNYMWEEYELTPHSAMNLRDEQFQNPAQVRKQINQSKAEIRGLGDVNVNAIEEYKEVSQRYEFMKAQHTDLVEAEQTLVGLIEELNTGMRKQFTEQFANIQREFDKAFKELFGGGNGTLQLVEDEDVLECGIRIIAHPPGKKLQNMMQLSGGEKSLTAIALLFAIQNLKPSPFCLLDEIEAALDDSNVNRFAKYLNKLTKHTQFIVITHRRGTMAAADRLYGITMQEKGVSALVSVSLIENDLTD